MRPVLRRYLILAGAALAVTGLSGCFSGTKDDGRPKPKPAQVTANLSTPNRGKDDAPLTLARISTKSGEILILEPDGSVTTMELDSAEGRDAFAVTEADLAALNANLDLDLGGLVASNLPREKTAQEKAIEAKRRGYQGKSCRGSADEGDDRNGQQIGDNPARRGPVEMVKRKWCRRDRTDDRSNHQRFQDKDRPGGRGRRRIFAAFSSPGDIDCDQGARGREGHLEARRHDAVRLEKDDSDHRDREGPEAQRRAVQQDRPKEHSGHDEGPLR